MQADNTLVSNVGQAAGKFYGLGSHDLAQPFTTGANATGYTLTSIELNLDSRQSTITPTVKLYSGSANGTEEATFTGPAMLGPGSANYTFTPTSTVILLRSTTYWVVAEGTGNVFWRGTVTDEDATSAADWEIGDVADARTASATGNFARELGAVYKIRVNGTLGGLVLSSDATLSALALEDASDDSAITISPAFLSGTTSYTASVDNDVDEITIEPTVNESNATVEYLDSSDAAITDADPGKTGQQVPLTVDANTIKVKVTAEDTTTTNTYTVVVTRAANTPATGAPSISGTATVGQVLTATTGTIADADGLPSNFTYQWVRVDADGTSNEADITGANSSTYPLADDDEIKKIKVKVSFTDNGGNSETRTSGAYPTSGTVQADNTLVSNVGQAAGKFYGLGSHDLAQPFTTGANATGYTLTSIELNLDSRQSTITPTVKLYSGSANGTEEATFTGPAMLGPGSANYTFTPTSTVILLRSTTYWVVAEGTGNVFWRGTVTDEDATSAADWEIGDVADARTASATGNFARELGAVYKIRVNGTLGGLVLSSDATLSALALEDASDDSAITISPAFLSGTTSYTASVDNDVDEITIEPTVNESNATVEYLDSSDAAITDADPGKTGQQVPLTVDANTIKVKVTAEDTTTTNTYTVVVTRAANTAPTSADGSVEADEDFDYPFSSDDFDFTDTDTGDSLASVKIVTLPASGTGTLTLSGTTIGSGDLPKTVLADEIDDLKYSPPANLHGTDVASFTFKVNDGTDDSADTYTMNINVGPENDPATGEPTISGTARVGRMLAASTAGIMDVDGLPSTFSYQWLRKAGPTTTSISGENSSTYTLQAADLGNKVAVRVSFTDDDGSSETLTSAATATVTTAITVSYVPLESEVTEGAGSIDLRISVTSHPTAGTPQAFEVLLSTADGTATVADDYVVVSGQLIQFGIGDTFQDHSISIIDDSVVESDETFTSTLSIGSGQPAVIDTRTDFGATATITIKDDDTANTAPTSADEHVEADEDTDYTFSSADFLFTDTAGDSLASIKIVTLPASGTGTLTLSGTTIGSGDLPKTVLAAEINHLKYSPPANLYGTDVASFTFRVNDGTVDSDDAFTITVDVTAMNDPATGKPGITGTAQVGQTLTATAGTIADVEGVPNPFFSAAATTVQWIQVDGATETDISGATSETYTLATADEGKKIKVKVSFDDEDGTAEGPLTSDAYPSSATVTAAPVTNNAPVFSSPSVSRSIAENTAADVNVGAAVTATDADAGDTLAYTLGGTDAASFDFVEATGQIRTKSGVSYDFEAKDSYTVTVTASDGTATAVATVTISITDVAEPPDAPTTIPVSAVAGSTTSLTVSWTAPANAGRPAIDNYDVQYRVSGATAWTDGPQNVTTTTTTIAGLVADTLYEVQVRATNAEGDSGWSDPPVSGRTNAPPNTAPTSADEHVEADEDTDYTFSSADFLFTDTAGDSLASIKIVTLPASGTGTLTLSGTTIGSGDLPKTVLAAEINHLKYSPPANLYGTDVASFTFRVNDGTVDSDDAFTITVDVTAMNDPATGKPGITGTAQVGQTLTATVGTIADLEGVPNPFFSAAATTVQWIQVDGANETDISGATNETYTLATADEGKKIKVKVSFEDEDGTAEGPLTSDAYPSSDTVTAAPVTNNAPVFSSRSVSRGIAENTAAGQNVGAAVTATDADAGDTLAYTLGGTDAASFDFVEATGQIRTKSGVSYDFEAKSSYTVTVTASDGTATDVATVTISITDVAEPPDAPTTISVSAVAGSTTSLTVSWTAPANAGRPDIDNYDVQYRVSGATAWTDGPQNVTTTTTTIAGLVADTLYEVQVRATNAEGDSGWSDPPESGRTNAPPNTAPTSADEHVEAAEDTDYTFEADNFAFTDTDTGDSLASVKILTLPASGRGTLTLSGTAIGSGDLPKTVPAAEIDDLKYSPPANLYGTDFASFTFKVNDGTVDSAGTYTMTIDVTAANDPATGEPTISGTARVGRMLTASTAGIMDVDGLPSTFSYRWLRKVGATTTSISGANSRTYTLQAADLGNKVAVRVSFTDTGGNSEMRTSGDYPTSGTVLANNTLVSNAGQIESNFGSLATDDLAQPFTTGTNATGYTLSSIELNLESTVSTNTPTVKLYSGSANGTEVSTFTGPATLGSGIASYTFTPFSTVTLRRSTTYWVVAEGATRWTYTRRAEDATPATGWSIADNYEFRTASLTGSFTATNTGDALQIRVNGTLGGIVLSSDATLSALALEDASDDSAIDISPTFASGTTSYTASVDNDVDGITIKPTVNESNATVEYLDSSDTEITDANSGKTGQQVSLLVGANTIKVKVTAEDTTTANPYTVVVTRAVVADTTPPEVVSVTVPISGSEVELVFDEDLDGNVGGNLLASVFSLTVAGQAVTIPDYDYAIREAALFLYVQPGTIKQGQTVVVSYTDPTAGDDTVALQDIAGNDVASFTTGMSGVPAVTNDSTVTPNTAPTGADNTVTMATDRSYTFVADDFGFADTDAGDTLDSISIVTPPASGTLAFDGTAVMADDVVTKAQLDNIFGDHLTFTPAAGASGDPYTSFTFKVNDGTDDSAAAYTMSITVNAIGAVSTAEVPDNWALKPADIGAGEQFRLIFQASGHPATSADIATYNSHVRSDAGAGVTALRSYADDFRALVSTQAVNVRTNTMTRATDTGVPIYWVRSDPVVAGDRVADNYADFYDGSWATGGTGYGARGFSRLLDTHVTWTGSNANGTTHSTGYMGASSNLAIWSVSSSGAISTVAEDPPSSNYGIFALSPVFQVSTTTVNTAATGVPTITGTAQVGETLTAVTTGIMDADGLTSPTYTYQWIRVDGSEADIASANSSTYTLDAADLGKTIKVKVSFTDDASNTETLTSAATATVTAATVTPVSGVLVSNVGQTPFDFVELNLLDAAQSFTTGDNATGYTLTSIELRFDSSASTDTPTVKLYSGSTNGTEEATLIGPAMLDADTTKNYAFTSSSTVTLGMSTTYWVVAEANTGSVRWIDTHSPSEDATPAAHWTIADGREDRSASSTGSFMTTAGNPLLIRVNGTTVATPTTSSDATLSALALENASDDSAITISPTFASGTTSYTASVDNDVDGITIKPTVNESSATVEYLDSSDTAITDADAVKAGQQVSLLVGANTIKVKVTAEDTTTTSTYTVVVTRNTAPTGADKTVTIGSDTAYTFEADDFGFVDTDAGATLVSVRIESVPLAGDLELNGTAVSLNDVIPSADIGDLTFTPAPGGSGDAYASFTFKVNDGTDFSADVNTITFNVRDLSCEAPDFAGDGRRELWTGIVTVGDINSAAYGFHTDESVGELDDTTFAIGRNSYTVDIAFVQSTTSSAGRLSFGLSGGVNGNLTAGEVAALQLHVCDTTVYDFSAATSSSNTYLWAGSLDWSPPVATRTLYLSLPANRDAMGEPEITGTAQVGQDLTADVTGITDADGLTGDLSTPTDDSNLGGVGYSYQWIRVDAGGTSNEEDISGEIAETYTLTDDDVGKKVKVKVDFTDDLNGDEERTSAAYPSSGTVTAVNTAPVFSSPSVSRSIAENTAADVNVGAAVTATDADAGDTLAYTLGGTDMTSFDIVGVSGQIRTKTGVSYDFEAKDSYTVTVTASDGTATAVATVTISITDVAEPPDAPTTISVSAVAGSTTSLTVSWTAPANAGRPAIDNYDVQYRVSGATAWTDGPQNVTTTTTTISGLVADTLYEVQVRATNAEGDSRWSDPPVSGRTNSPANNAPEFATDTTSRSFTETVGDAAVSTAGNVGAVVTATDADSDTLTYSLEGTDAAKFGIVSSSGQIQTKVGEKYDREAKASYSVTVKADDSNGGSDTIAVTITVDNAVEKPLAPAMPAVTATSGITTSLDVSWMAPANTGRPAITGYKVEYRAGVSGNWINHPHTGTGTTATIATLTAATAYQVQVLAVNSDGDGLFSGPGSGTTGTNTPATGVPTITGTAQVGQTLTAVTTGIADANGLTSPTYTYQWIRANGTEADIASANSSTYTLDAADLGKTIKVKVSFADDDGNPETLTSAATATVTAAPTAQTDVWTATLTPGDLNLSILGCGNHIDSARCSTTTVLSEDSFNYDSTDYTITKLFVRSGGHFQLDFDADITTATAALTLVVGSTSLVLADADTIASRQRIWHNSGVSLTEGTDIVVKLTTTATTTNTAPTSADEHLEADEDTDYTFVADEFAFTDTDTGDSLASVKIVTLPASGTGTLTLSGTTIGSGDLPQTVLAAEIGNLKYSPPANLYGTDVASFTFKVNDGTVDSDNAYTMTIDVKGENDSATGAPTITGTAQVGQTLTATVGTIADVDGLPNPFFSAATTTVQWIQVDGASETDISGATSETYTLATADAGKTIKVKVSFEDEGGTAEGPLTSDAYPSSGTVTAAPTNTAPTAADNTVTAVAGTAYTFEADDFGFADADAGDMLASVKIESLPTVGTLALAGMDVTLNQVVTKAQIDDGDLTFTPVDGASGTGYANFTFKVNDGTVFSDNANTITFNVRDLSCAAPDFAGDGRRQLWSGTVTVGDIESEGYGFRSDLSQTGLDDTTFAIGRNSYTVDTAYVESVYFSGRLSFGLTGGVNDSLTAGEKAALRLHVCAATSYDFSATSANGENTYKWAGSLDWSPPVVTRTLYLSLPANHDAMGAPTITGTARAAQELTADVTGVTDADGLTGDLSTRFDNSNPSGVEYSYQWIRVDADGASNPTIISGTTEATYTLTDGDAGKKVKVQVSFTDDLNGEEELTSEAFPSTDTVSANNAPVFSSPSVSRSIAENTAAGVDVGAAVTATDTDTLTYTLGGTDMASFDIVRTTGQIRTKAGVGYDHEAKGSYTVTVTASDGAGSAVANVTISVTDVDEPPDAPAPPMVLAVAASTTSLSVSWAAPANDGKPPIDSYDVQYRAGSSGTWSAGPQNIMTTTTTIIGLVADTLYQARVRATNAEGDSGWSSPPGSGRTNALGVAQTGALVSNTGQANSGQRVVGTDEYAQPFDTGNNSSGYNLAGIVLDLQAAPTGTGTLTITVREDLSGNPVRAALYTLVNPALAAGLNEFRAPENAELGANTTYWVVATYSADSGGPTWYRTVRSRVDAGAAAGWAIGATYKIDGRVARDGWVVDSSPRALQIAVKGTAIGGANTAPTAADNTVATAVDTPYTFTADDFGFTDTDFANMLASVRIVTVPAPGTLALDGTAVLADAVVTKAQIDGDMLTFTPVAGASGAPYTTFTFKVNDGTVDSANAYTMTIDVTAVAAEPPGAPGNLRTTPGDGRVTLTWTAPANTGGAAILKYRYRARQTGTTPWTPNWMDVPDGSDPGGSAADETRVMVSGLTNGTEYRFEVRAVNRIGGGTAASRNETPVATPARAPGRPRSLLAASGDGQVTLTWEAPQNDGGADIVRYDYRHAQGTSVPASEPWLSAGLNLRQTVAGLDNGRQYTFEVRAANSAGESDPASIQARPAANANAPSAPRFVKAVTSDRHVGLTWLAPARDGGSSISKYEYRHASGASVPGDTPWSSVRSYRLQAGFGSLINGQRYTFQVRAVGAEEGPAASVTATPSANPVRREPGAVSGLAATAEAYADDHRRRQYGRVTLTWSPSAGDDNSVLERFEYRYAESGSALPARWLHGPSDRLSETVKRLKLETVYVFEVRAVNLEGPGRAVRRTVRTPASAVGTGLISLYATQSTAIEGGALTFEVRRASDDDDKDPATFVLVAVTDTAFPGGNRLLGEDGLGMRVVKFQSGARSASGTVRVAFDGARPSSRTVTVSLQSVEEPYYYGTPTTLGIEVTDRDAAVSVRDAQVREAPGAALAFVVTLDRRRDREVMVNYATAGGTATEGEDYTRTAGTLVFSAGETSKTVSVPVIDDTHDEGRETLTLTLSNARGAVLGDATATGTIVNTDRMPDAWLSRFGRAASDQVVQSIGRRLEGGARESHLTVMGWRVDTLLESTHSERDGREPRADAPGRQANGSVRAPEGRTGAARAMAGATRGVGAMSGPGAARPAFDGAMTQGFPPMQGGTLQSPARAMGGLPGNASGSPANAGGNPASAAAVGARDNRWLDLMGRLFMSLGPNGGEALAMPGLRDMVMGSSFYYGYSPDAGLLRGMNRMTAWGESASTRFSGAEGKLSLDGEVNTAILGADGEWGRWLAGLALSYSEGEGGYRQASAKGGAVSSTLSGVNPYARYRLDERTSFWGTLGYGSGRLTLTPDGAESSLETDMTNAMAAFGGRGVLSMRGGETGQFELALRSDAMLTDTASMAVAGLSGGEGATSRIRLILEGSGSLPAFGGVLAPKVEAGLRYDGGDAETGAGLEVGGGLAYEMDRLTVQVDGRVLLTHRDRDYEEWGYSLSFEYKPASDGRGLRYQAGSQWGATQSGVQSLWSLQNAGGLANGARTADGQRYTAELGYGFGERRLWYPYVATESGGASSQALRFGLKLNAASDLEAGLEIGRRAHLSGQIENDIRLQWRARW